MTFYVYVTHYTPAQLSSYFVHLFLISLFKFCTFFFLITFVDYNIIVLICTDIEALLAILCKRGFAWNSEVYITKSSFCQTNIAIVRKSRVNNNKSDIRAFRYTYCLKYTRYIYMCRLHIDYVYENTVQINIHNKRIHTTTHAHVYNICIYIFQI